VLLVWLLAAAQGTAVGPPHDLAGCLAVAARFGSADHSAAMGEIRSWALPELEAAAGLRRQGRRRHAVPEAPRSSCWSPSPPTSPDLADAPGWHELEVRLTRGNGDVLARPGYWRFATAP
jgi:hypothetical protein